MLNGGAGALTLDRRTLDARRFGPDRCATLFAAVLADDDFVADAAPPAIITVDYHQDQLADCYALARELWWSRFDRIELIGLVKRIARDRTLGDSAAVAFKHVRARLKLFRYAHALFRAEHRYPPLLNRLTVTMGQLQDACRTHHTAVVLCTMVLLRLLLTRPMMRKLRQESDSIALASGASFRALIVRDLAALDALVAGAQVLGHQFHAGRKIIGRQVAFWNMLDTIAPSAERQAMNAVLSSINGLMGEVHDRMIERRMIDRASYAAAFVLPDAIRVRIAALAAAYHASLARDA